MNLFYLTSEFLWPPHHGGRVRSLSQLRLLASLGEVKSITMLGFTEVPIGKAEEKALLRSLPKTTLLPAIHHPIHLRKHPLALARVAALRLLLGKPYLAAKWENQEAQKALSRLALCESFDVVYIDHLGMANYLPKVRSLWPRARVVLDSHNVESDFFLQFAERQRPPLSHLARWEYQATLRFEEEILRAADALVAISEADANALSVRSHQLLTVVVPQVVEPSLQARKAPDKNHLCYVGNLTWHPNVRGLDWFCQQVWPLIRAQVPDAELTIAGSGLKATETGTLEIPKAWQVEGVKVVGFVPDLEPLYATARLMIAPILDGSGVRIKLLESLKAGMPVVTTKEGAKGLPLQSGREVLLAEEPTDFAKAVVDLLKNPQIGASLREAGYAFLAEHHSQALAATRMRRALGLSVPPCAIPSPTP